MTPAPSLAAVVVTHNRLAKLKTVLTALQNQTRAPDRVYVVDNASCDGTDAFLTKFCADTPRFTHLRLPGNIGGAGGFHAGTRRAYDDGHDLIWLSDDDAYPAPNAIEILETALHDFEAKNQFRPAFACSMVKWTDGSICEMNVPTPVWDWPRFFTPETAQFLIASCSFVSVLIPRSSFDSFGFPIKDYFIWYDDVEFTQLIAQGAPGIFCPESIAVHDIPENKGVNFTRVNSENIWKFRYGARNEASARWRNHGWASVAIYLRGAFHQMRAGRVPWRLRLQVFTAIGRGLFFKPEIDHPNGAQWHDKPHLFRLLHERAPMLAETLKYHREARMRSQMTAKHRFQPLPLNTDTPDWPDQPRDLSKDPAVLIGFHWLAVGGAEKLAFQTVNWALEMGLRVFITTEHPGPHPLANTLPRTERLTILHEPLTPRAASNLVARENIVLTYNHHCGPLYRALPALKAHHPKVLNVDAIHIIEHRNGGFPRESAVWDHFLDARCVISNELKTFFETHTGSGEKTHLGRLLDAKEPKPLNIRAEKPELRIAFVGRMTHQKRPLLMPEIMEKLPKCKFEIVGEGPYRTPLERIIARRGLSARVHFHPAHTDISALLSRCDVLLMPSANEGLALVGFEAIEQGCVPIATDVGAQSELIPRALLVPARPKDTVRAMVEIVKHLHRDAGFAREMENALHKNYRKLAAEPSAETVSRDLFRQALPRAGNA